MYRLSIYLTTIFDNLSAFYLILASIDRIFSTSPNALIRRRSMLHLAYICIFTGTLFWVLFHSPALILTNIIEFAPNYFQCYYQPGVYLVFTTYYLILTETVGLLLMIICDSWTVKNIRSLRRVGSVPSLSPSQTVVENNLQLTSSKDRQLIPMLWLDITIYGSFSFMFSIFLIYQQIRQDAEKSPGRIEIEVLV